MTEPIFAIATALQRTALHLHRISGNGSIETLQPYLKKNKLPFRFPSNPHFPFTQYLSIYDEQGTQIDDLIITFYRSPKSFTGEDMIELSCHGNPLISQKLQSLFRSLGFRDAREGEFTSRGFLNGKFDLAQAEAIRELIHAETYAGLQMSRNQLNGALTFEIEELREKFIDILSYLEAHIDFAPDEVGNYEPIVLIPKLKEIFNRLLILKDSYVNGLKLKEGLKIVICGKPNAGKSTLYNKLLNSDRAIVTDIAGTTRDVLTERLVIENRDFVLMDTAGLRNSKNIVEKLGIDRSYKALKEADIICHVIDGSKNIPTSIPITQEQKNIFVISKTDLITEIQIQKIKHHFEKKYPSTPIVFISQKDISELKVNLIQIYDVLLTKPNSAQIATPMILSTRSHDIVKQVLTLLDEVFVLLENNELPEKIASTLYCALKKCEEILGEVDIDKIYEKIFSTFCIGK